ncbi:MAG TPA: hypothetical protein V6C57_18275 [Coleofasciculaceae cyanobacterium]
MNPTREAILKIVLESRSPVDVVSICDRLNIADSVAKKQLRPLVSEGLISKGKIDYVNKFYYAVPGFAFPYTNRREHESWQKGRDTILQLIKLCPHGFMELQKAIKLSRGTTYEIIAELKIEGLVVFHGSATSGFLYAPPGVEVKVPKQGERKKPESGGNGKERDTILKLIATRPYSFLELQKAIGLSHAATYEVIAELKIDGLIVAREFTSGGFLYAQPQQGDAIFQLKKTKKPKVKKVSKPPKIKAELHQWRSPKPTQATPTYDDKTYSKSEQRILDCFKFQDEVLSSRLGNHNRLDDLLAIRSLIDKGEIIKVGRCPAVYAKVRSRRQASA